MNRPVLVTPPAIMPVSLIEAKAHLDVDFDDKDMVIEDLVRTATEHLDGWEGIMGQCLVEQEWRQDFDAFRACLPLALGPVISISSVTVSGDTLDPSTYSIKTDAGGRSRVEFSGVAASGAVSVTYKAGYATIPEVPEIPAVDPGPGDPPDPVDSPAAPAIPAKSTVPQDIKNAIIIYVKAHFDDHKPDAMASAMRAFDSLISKRRRVGV